MLLQMFSRDSSYQRFCLAHLFTHIAFDNGVLGLAYIAGSRVYSVGGICSPSEFSLSLHECCNRYGCMHCIVFHLMELLLVYFIFSLMCCK